MVERLAGAGMAALQVTLGALPDGPSRALGRGVAGLAHSVLRIRRRTVETQLAASFPERSREWVRETAGACYRHFGEELAVLAGRPARIRAALDSVEPPVRLDDVLPRGAGRGRGAILVTAHLGNWDLAGAYVARQGFPVTAVAQRQWGVERRLRAMRARLGIDISYTSGDARALLRALRGGHMLALVADQHARRGGVRLPFLGRPAWTTLGPARLSLAAGVPLFFGGLVREGRGYRPILERIETPPAPPDERPEVALTRAWLETLEAQVRRTPEQYFWFHRRWKGGRRGPGGTPSGADLYEGDRDPSRGRSAHADPAPAGEP